MAFPAGTPRGPGTAAAELAQAEQFYRQLVGEHPRHTEAWFQLGLIAIRQARYPAAVEALTLVVSLDPARIQGRHQLAAAYQALGEHERAVAQYAEVVRLKPECAEAYSDWGVALVRHGRFDEAGTAFARAADIKPDFPEAHNNAGNVHVEKGEFAEALEHFQRAISLRPDYAEAHHNRGFALARLGSLDESAISFQEAVRCRADYVDAHFRLANVLRDLKRFGEAIESYRAVLRLRPEYFEARTQLALTLAHEDQLHADWRWLRHREDSLWYPTARLFRQQRWGDWDEVIARIAAELPALGALPAGASRKIVSWETLLPWRQSARQQGRTVVWTNGCFDLLHPGHIRSLNAARALGDALVVGVNDDEAVRRLKGPTRPILPARDRAELLAALECVDAVVLFGEDTPSAALDMLRPDIHCKGADYAPPDGKPIPEAAVVAAYGGRIEYLPLVPGMSTSDLVERIAGRG